MAQQRSKRNRRRKFKVESLPQQLQHINVNAAGIDIGAEQHFVAVPEGRAEVAVRQFGAFTADLIAIADWLAASQGSRMVASINHNLRIGFGVAQR